VRASKAIDTAAALLLVLSANLAAAAAQDAPAEGAAAEAAARPPAGTDPAAAPASPNPLHSLRLEGLESTRNLPLFTTTRTPPVVEATPEPPPEPEAVEPEVVEEPPPEPPALKLIGIVMTAAEQVALLSDEATGEVQRLRPGEDYDGWTLKIVDSRTVELANAEQRHTLTMFTEYGDPPPQVNTIDPQMLGMSPEELQGMGLTPEDLQNMSPEELQQFQEQTGAAEQPFEDPAAEETIQENAVPEEEMYKEEIPPDQQ
jgi:general secretion pathway protein N